MRGDLIPKLFRLLLAAALLLAATVWAEPAWPGLDGNNSSDGINAPPSFAALPAPSADVSLVAPVSLPRMAPELALDTYERQAAQQSAVLAGYSATTIIQAELPETAERGQYELKRRYTAPNTLKFIPVKFTGNSFVKGNVITRLLQSEVDHVSRREGAQTAINSRNYKFSYKGDEEIDGRQMHVFHLKPRQKRPGLFKGRIFVDVTTGMLRRAEGTMVKSPSFFVKKVEFVQDYADFRGFTFPVHMHSVARTRLVGRAVVDVVTGNYEVLAPDTAQTAISSSGPATGTSN